MAGNQVRQKAGGGEIKQVHSGPHTEEFDRHDGAGEWRVGSGREHSDKAQPREKIDRSMEEDA